MTAATTTKHHPDCDGFRTAHRVDIQRVATSSAHTPFLYEAHCQECGKLHVGSVSTSAGAERFAAGHSKWVECDGRCLEWS